MMLSENVRMALGSIRKARVRSFFTMAGIIIGVVSVITIVSLGEGVKRQISGQINQAGSDLITIRPGKLVNRDASGRITSVNILAGLGTSTLTEQDLTSVQANPNLQTVVPFSIVSGVAKYDNREFSEGMVIATTSEFPRVISQKTEFGNFFSAAENDRRNAVLGAGTAEKLFHEAAPLGKSLKIRGQDFIVRGVLEHFPDNPAMPGTDFNNAVFIPTGAAKALGNNQLTLYELLVKPKSSTDVNKDVSELTATLKNNHDGQTDFTILKQEEAVSVAGNVLTLIAKLIISMAAVSLFVGGIGIMNVMLVSVSERNREIGIRKAIGATNRQIRTQFMVEAAVLSVWGVILGVFLSGLTNLALRIFTDLQPIITWQPVVYASAVSVIIGIASGVIPAVKASRKDPIDALRPS